MSGLSSPHAKQGFPSNLYGLMAVVPPLFERQNARLCLVWGSRVAVILLLLLFDLPVQAANPLDAIINEIAWMGTAISHNNEWVELYNSAVSPIDLSGWKLISQDGTPEINLSGVISGQSFYLLERTDDNTVPNISADQIYKGALGNTGENLKLYDNSGNLIDEVNCSSGWFAGDNKTKQTMERGVIERGVRPGSDPENWQTSQNPGGTPRAQNSIVLIEIPKPTEETQKTEEKPVGVELLPTKPTEDKPGKVEPPPVKNYPSGIIFNEILPSAEGPDEENEWIEIFNENGFEVDLSDWQIEDIIGKVRPYNFSKGTKISPKGFLVLSRPTTQIILNNNGDSLRLIQPNNEVSDSVTYEKASRGQSYNRTESGWVWSTILTPGSTNIVPSPTSKTEATKSDKTEGSTPSKELKETQKQLAAIGEQIPKPSKSLYIFLIALAIAVFSGVIVLILKRGVKSKQLL